jgi:3(or 17)beta-hydroxysteroid dehydrogenase
MGRLKDKIVLITGAAGSIGKAVADVVAAAGGLALTSDLAGKGAAHSLDVTSETDWQRLMADIGHAHGQLDGLVNAAGLAALGSI